jgi:hypothetical protein
VVEATDSVVVELEEVVEGAVVGAVPSVVPVSLVCGVAGGTPASGDGVLVSLGVSDVLGPAGVVPVPGVLSGESSRVMTLSGVTPGFGSEKVLEPSGAVTISTPPADAREAATASS